MTSKSYKITLPEPQFERFEREAREKGMTKSAFLTQLLREHFEALDEAKKAEEEDKPNHYMKKWWLETTLPDGRIFKGWINTTAERKEDFPEMLHGTVCAWKDEVGLHGYFLLDGQDKSAVAQNWQYVCMHGLFNPPVPLSAPPLSRLEADLYLKSIQPLNCGFQRFDRRLEDCIVLSKTYIDSYRTASADSV